MTFVPQNGKEVSWNNAASWVPFSLDKWISSWVIIPVQLCFHMLSSLVGNSQLAQRNCLCIFYTCRPCHTCWPIWGKLTKIVIALPSILFVLLNSALYESLTKEGSRVWPDHVMKPDRLNIGSSQYCGLEYVDIKSSSPSGLPHSIVPFQSNQSSENPIYLGKEKYRNRMSRAYNWK